MFIDIFQIFIYQNFKKSSIQVVQQNTNLKYLERNAISISNLKILLGNIMIILSDELFIYY